MDFHLLVILSCLLVAGTAHDCYELDTDYPGNDINKDAIIRESAEECQALCSQTEKCNYFTWVPIEKHCWLKTEGGPAKALNYDERHAISGPRVCEKKSSAGPPNNFLNAFNAQWTCSEKYELLNEYEMTSLIFKETLQIFINMTEGKKFSECYTNDVTSSTSNGPQTMYLYTNENSMCNNTQYILTTFNTESSSNYVTCLLHHPTRITSTTSSAFVATALCANIYEEIDPAPVITSVTCLGNSTPTKEWKVHVGIGDCWSNGIYKYEKLEPYPVDDQEHTLANCKDKCAQHSHCEAIIMDQAKVENGNTAKCFMIKKINNIFNDCKWGHTNTFNVYEKKDTDSFSMESGINYAGNNIDWKDVPTAKDCAKWCNEKTECKAWTWAIASKTCYRKYKIGERISNPGTISGISVMIET